MSHSLRRTPVTGLSTKSDKGNKTRAHRVERHAVKSKLSETLDQDTVADEHKRSGSWAAAKAKADREYLKHPTAKDLRK